MTRAPARAAAAYGHAAQAVPPLRQVVMLYDGAIRKVGEAKLAIAEGRIEDRFNAVQKAAAIVDALHACLDFERGGDIARLLDRLYIYISLRLQAINTANDPALCDEVIARLGDLRGAWNGLIEGQTPTAAPTAPRSEGASLAA
jgi:flagellar protein FliS